MSARRTVTAILLPLVLCLSARVLPGQQRSAAWMATYDQLRSMAPRFDRSAAVRDLTLRRDVAEFRLKDGRLTLLSDVGGRTIGAVFTGTGTFAFTPPLTVERQRANQILGDSNVGGPIRAAVFLFADTTLAELVRGRTFGASMESGDLRSRVDDARDFLLNGRLHEVDPALMASLLDSTLNGYFAAYVKRERGEDLLIRIDPGEREDIRLQRRGRQVEQPVETVCRFASAARRDTIRGTAEESSDPLSPSRYRIEARIGRNYEFRAVSTLTLRARRATGRWVHLTLFRELEVDSVTDDAARPLEYFRSDRSADLWVRFSAPAADGGSQNVRVVYHGPLIEHGSLLPRPPASAVARAGAMLPPRVDNWTFIRSTQDWFPMYGQPDEYGDPADMELTFRTPRDLRFASIGRLVDSVTNGDTLVTRWTTEAPTFIASFNIGEFEAFEITDPRIPPVTVFYNSEAHSRLQEVLRNGHYSQESVAGDIASSLSFFSSTYGPPLFAHYYATEIPYFHGQAFPGLIHLSWATFLDQSDEGTDESFRSHEMAHQWWGIAVEPASYRDWWMSEGFAEFSGLWYMQSILHDNEKYFRKLHDSREEIFRRRDRASPIGLGPRALENASGAYTVMVYKKGAWVLHMLRNLMLDTRTMSDERFSAMMRDFYTRYRGRRASTGDFQRVVEDHIGRPMGWFFDEWVNATALPRYTFAWSDSLRADSTHLVHFRVRQEGVPESFSMYVPLQIEMNDGRHVIVRINVRGRAVEGRLPLPAAPAFLKLNPLESVLAEVHTEDWH